MRKEEARAIYENIVRQQRDPALLEYVGRDLFQARIFPIPPGGQRTIELTYSQVLPRENGLVRYTYPLRVYPLLQVGRRPEYVQPIGQLAIRADIEATSPIKTIYSPTHPIAVARDGEFKASRRLRAIQRHPDQRLRAVLQRGRRRNRPQPAELQAGRRGRLLPAAGRAQCGREPGRGGGEGRDPGAGHQRLHGRRQDRAGQASRALRARTG